MTDYQLPITDPPPLAYFSPLPPARTGIADYTAKLLPALAEYTAVILFSDTAGAALPHQPTAAYAAQRWPYAGPLYHMGNSLHHATIYEHALRYPGVVVLHDHNLHHFQLAHAAEQGHYGHYVRELSYAQGWAGAQTAARIPVGLAAHPTQEPLNQRLLDSSLGVLVHSHYAQQLIAAAHPNLPTAVAPALAQALDHRLTADQRAILRRQLQIPPNEDTFLLACAGQITPHKQIALILQVLAELRGTHPHTHLLLLGEPVAGLDLTAAINGLGLAAAVHTLGYVADELAFANWLGAADVLLNLRYPTLGETSAAALQGMAVGLPVVVFDHGWYAELPDDACLKLPPLDGTALLATLRHLAEQPALRHRLGTAARTHITAHHQPHHTAEAYAKFLQTIY